jgi:rubrerythrin
MNDLYTCDICGAISTPEELEDANDFCPVCGYEVWPFTPMAPPE